MPSYRRAHIAGGTYFFTLKTARNQPVFKQTWAVDLLRDVLREATQRWHFEIDAIVVLPDHLHAILTLSRGDDQYSTYWAWIKKEFTKRYLEMGGAEVAVSRSQERHRRRGVWQRRFWEHTINDEDDFDAHFDYTHWNPVKHGYVSTPEDWPNSSFTRWVRRGVYSPNWGSSHEPDTVSNVKDAGE